MKYFQRKEAHNEKTINDPGFQFDFTDDRAFKSTRGGVLWLVNKEKKEQ